MSRFISNEEIASVEMATSTASTSPSSESPIFQSGEHEHFFRRRPASGNPMAIFHAQVVEILHRKIENRELELVSDAETLSADEVSNCSWSSCGTNDSAVELQPAEFTLLQDSNQPRVIVLPIPQFESFGYHAMEIGVDVRAYSSTLAEQSEANDGDVSSENTSRWSSDEDEKIIQLPCQEVSMAESDESGEDRQCTWNGAGPSSNSSKRPRVYRPHFFDSCSETSSPPSQPEKIHRPSSKFESSCSSPRYQVRNDELMEQDDHDLSGEESASLCVLPRRELGDQRQFHLDQVQSSVRDNGREFNYHHPHYSMQHD